MAANYVAFDRPDSKDDPDGSNYILHMNLKSSNVALGKRKIFDIDVPEESPDQDGDNDTETVISLEDEDPEETEDPTDTEDEDEDEDDEDEDEDEDESDEPGSSDQDRLQNMARQALRSQPQRRVMGEIMDNRRLGSSSTASSSEDRPGSMRHSSGRGTIGCNRENANGSRSRSSDRASSSRRETIEGEGIETGSNQRVSRKSSNSDSDHHHDKIGDPEDYETSDDDESLPKSLLKYPTIKLMDFGLARRTGSFDTKNPNEVREQGTEGYESPEQLRLGRKDIPPLHRYTDHDFQIDEKQNVWGVGLIMHDLITLSPPGFVRSKLNNMGPGHDEFYRHLVGPQDDQKPRRHFTDELQTKRKPESTLPLRDLIRRCIRPCRAYRPSSSRLVKLVEAGLRQYLYDTERNGRRRRTPDPKHRVCLTVSDFNKLKTLGDANNRVDIGDYDDIQEFRLLNDKTYADIGEAFLLPPKKKWKQFFNEYPPDKDNNLEDVEGTHWHAVGDKVLFDKHGKKKRVVSWESRTHTDPDYRGNYRRCVRRWAG